MKEWIETLKEKTMPYRSLMSAGRLSATILMWIAMTLLLGEMVADLYPVLPFWAGYPVAAGIVIVLTFALYLLIRVIFGGKSLSRAAFLLLLTLLLMMFFAADHDAHPVTCILFALLGAFAADGAGRAVVGMIRTRQFRISGLVTFLVSGAVIAGFVLAFLQKGFGENRIPAYTSLRTKSAEAPKGFSDTLENGSLDVKSFSYGPGSNYDRESQTIDLSEMAERKGIAAPGMKLYFNRGLDQAPVCGRVWYPLGKKKCPTLFIVHGNHNYGTESFLGYEYLCRMLATNGYVAVSVDENILNDLSDENDARAVLMLENMKQLLKWSEEDSSSPLYGMIDPEKFAVAGHSRGGETAALTALLTNYDRYPENGSIKLGYHIPIQSVIAIAPTCDQYQPAGRSAVLEDVNYLMIHGADDQDVFTPMGEKQYNNVHFTGEKDCFKSMIFLLGANHGQFNTKWGDNDMGMPFGYVMNRNAFLNADDQRALLCAYVKTFLDVTLKGDTKYRSLFSNPDAYRSALPDTVTCAMYQDSEFEPLTDFNAASDLAVQNGVKLNVKNADLWTEQLYDTMTEAESGDYGLYMEWDDENDVTVSMEFDKADLSKKSFSFAVADLREKDVPRALLDYTVTLTDSNGKTATAKKPMEVFPALGIQATKFHSLWFDYVYRHPFTTVTVPQDAYQAEDGFDPSKVTAAEISFRDMKDGKLLLNDIGFAAK